MTITYYEYYPHYMGTMSATIKFTEAQFNEMINLAKNAIKANKADEDDTEYERLDNFIETIAKKQKEKVFAMTDALLNYFDSPRRPSAIVNALKKKGVWSDQWEEGSFAFSNKGVNVAREAVRAIEAEHCLDGW